MDDKITFQIDLINILVAVIATWGLKATWNQLREQKLSTRASVLLSLDERWSSEAVHAALAIMDRLIIRVRKEIDSANPTMREEDKRKLRGQRYKEELDKLRDAASTDYYELIKVSDFFETVGYVSREKYVPVEDVVKLFGIAIDYTGFVFEGHIRGIQDELSDNTTYEHFIWLLEKTRKIRQETKCKCSQPTR